MNKQHREALRKRGSDDGGEGGGGEARGATREDTVFDWPDGDAYTLHPHPHPHPDNPH